MLSFLIKYFIKTIDYKELPNIAPNYFFVNKNFEQQTEYDKGFSLNELFPISTSGIKTHSDGTLVDFRKFENSNQLYDYRPFDIRNIEYDLKKVQRHRFSVMRHMLKDNLAIMTCRQLSTFAFQHVLISKYLIDMCTVSLQTKETTYAFPLYLYPETSGQQTIEQTNERTPNLNKEIALKIARSIRYMYAPDVKSVEDSFRDTGITLIAPIDILDYIYAVLHSPTYREKYKEFLKIDFPRVPYPKKATIFWQLVKLGGELRQIHLLESPIVEKYITQYPIDGNNVVGKTRFENSPPLEGCPTGGVVNNTTSEYFTIKNTKIYHNTITELPYNPKLKERAKALRYAENLSEVLFWMQVHKNHFYKIDFDRQRIIGNYIVDFYVKKLGLVIEIDGASHDGKEKKDAEREDYLKSLGLIIFRIPVVDVLQNMGKAMNDLESFIIENYSKPFNNVEEPPRPSGTPPKEGNCSNGNFGKVYINETQYFDNVPQIAWEFYIGGYQPAQKWLKDRKERKLEFDDILHYQKIIVALSETDRLMKEIEKIEIE